MGKSVTPTTGNVCSSMKCSGDTDSRGIMARALALGWLMTLTCGAVATASTFPSSGDTGQQHSTASNLEWLPRWPATGIHELVNDGDLSNVRSPRHQRRSNARQAIPIDIVEGHSVELEFSQDLDLADWWKSPDTLHKRAEVTGSISQLMARTG